MNAQQVKGEAPMSQLDKAVADIQAALYSGALTTARQIFRDNYNENAALENGSNDLVQALGDATPIPENTILWGPGFFMFSNPLRDDFVARCGVRSGDCPIRAWVLYKTPRGAQQAARRHAEEHRAKGEPVPVVAEWGTV